VLEAEHHVVRTADDHHRPLGGACAPGFHPEIEDIVPLHMGHQRAYHGPLWHSDWCLRPLALLRHSGPQPLLDEAEDARIGHAVLEELDEPCVGQRVEAAPQVTLQPVVHALPRQGHRERVQGVMRTAPRSVPLGDPSKILLIDLGEDGHHGLLDELVFQGGDPQRALPPIRLRDGDSPGRVRPIGPAVHSAVEVGESFLHAGRIRVPGHPIHSGGRMSLPPIETVPQQIDREMVA
jgi:hypothetical protein